MRLASRKRVTLSASKSIARPESKIAVARIGKTSVMASADSTESKEKIRFITTIINTTFFADFPDLLAKSVSRCSIDSMWPISLTAVYMMKIPPRINTQVAKLTPPVITPVQSRITKGSAIASISWIIANSNTTRSATAIRMPQRRTAACWATGARWLSMLM